MRRSSIRPHHAPNATETGTLRRLPNRQFRCVLRGLSESEIEARVEMKG